MAPSASMMPGQPTPINGARRNPSSPAHAIKSQHPGQLLDCVLALGVLLIGMSPKLELPDRGLGKVGPLSQVKHDHTGTDVGTADIDRQDRVVCFEYPVRCQICGTD